MQRIWSKIKGLFGFSDVTEIATVRRRKKQWETASAKVKTFAFVVLVFGELAFFYAMLQNYGLIEERAAVGDKIAVVDFNEAVTQEYVNKVIKQLEKIKDNEEYKEVLFVVNSPGGSPTASEELSEYLKDFKEEKPVTMYIQEIAASGAYYIASSVKPLYTNKNALVGSIGVILPHYSIGELAQKVGVEEDDVSAGEFKKPISMFKKIGDEEKDYLKKQMITPTYKNFIRAVATNRGISEDKLLPYTEGKIYIGNNPDIKDVLVDEVTVLHRLKAKMKDRYENISFAEVKLSDKKGLFGSKVELDVKLDSDMFNASLR